MPPKKASAKAAAYPPLQGCVITFASGSIPANTLSLRTIADIKAQISEKGGSYATKVEECTHLVVSETQYNKNLAKVKEAKERSVVTIISFDWLEKAFSAKSLVNEQDFILHDRSQTSTITAMATTAKSNGQVHVKAEDEDEDGSSTQKQPPRKRKRPAKDDVVKDETGDNKENMTDQKNGKASNITKNRALKIPLDDVLMSEGRTNYEVYVDPDGSIIYDVTLNQSDSRANANKFYRLQLLKHTLYNNTWYTWTRWGRVGETGQSAMLGEGDFGEAMAHFEKKFKDKTGNSWMDRNGPLKPKKYAFIERSYEDSDSEDDENLPGADKRRKLKDEHKQEQGEEDEKAIVESKLPLPVQDLIKLIFNQDFFKATFDSFDYDAEKMPLGKLSKSTLMRGYEVLKTLSGLVGSAGNANQISTLSNQYLSLIPHVVSRSSRPPVLSNMNLIKKEIELLEALTDMQLANDLMKEAKKTKDKADEANLLDRQFQGLGLNEMEPVPTNSKEFKELEAYLTKSIGYSHGVRYMVEDIFRIERQGEQDRFEQSQYAKVPNKNRRLLWHGSRATNFGGILSQGLRIAPPEAPVSGYMFGKGVYLADMSSKSAGYCASYTSGNTGLLLLCEAELGQPPLKLTNADYDAGKRAKASNCLSTWGVGQTAPQVWKDASCIHPSLKGVSMPDVVVQPPGSTNEPNAYLMYNEFIVYDVAQIKLRYLFRVRM